MSTPMNPNGQPHMGAAAPGGPGQVPGPQGPGGPMPNGGAPVVPQPVPTPAPGQGLDSGSPSYARLPQPLGTEGRTTPVGFGRLVGVELRKMTDTRAGKWLLGASLALMLLIAVAISFQSDVRENPDFGTFLSTSVVALKYILPIIGVLGVTSEWSQRTGLVTFALEPRRTRVGFAKWLAALIMGAIVIAFTIAMAALMTVIVSALAGHDADWSFGADRVGWFVMIFLLFVSMGVAFGLLIQNTPAAICAFLFIPILYSIVTSMPALEGFGEWTDPNQNLFSLLDDSGDDNPYKVVDPWPKILVGQLIWLVLPMVLGFIRLNRREVKSS